MKTLLALLCILTAGQDDTEKKFTISDRISVGTSSTVSVIVDNIFGQVTIERGKSDEVNYDVIKTIRSKDPEALERGVTEVQLQVIERNDSIIFYLEAPFICESWNGSQRGRGWKRSPEDYEFQFDFKVTLPASSNLDVRTVGQGNISITGIEGKVSAHHVNGDVEIKGSDFIKRASTVNGDVRIYFKSHPQLDGHFSTINGTIDLFCDNQINAQVNAKTMNGSLFSAFAFQQLSPKLEKSVSRNGITTTYTVEKNLGIQIGKEGPSLNFETLNGDIYLRQF